jgi:hypothetical protein
VLAGERDDLRAARTIAGRDTAVARLYHFRDVTVVSPRRNLADFNPASRTLHNGCAGPRHDWRSSEWSRWNAPTITSPQYTHRATPARTSGRHHSTPRRCETP